MIKNIYNKVLDIFKTDEPFEYKLEVQEFSDMPHKFYERRRTEYMKLYKLKGTIPDDVITELSYIVDKYELNTDLRLAHFLSQCAHESSDFRLVEENLNYSADALLRVFPKYFNSETALKYARKPILIASRVYGNRMGNGDERSLEGWKYRGRGYIQLTGKNNYQAFSDATQMDFVNNPDLIKSPKYALLSAAWFFTKNGIHKVADYGNDLKTLKEVTRRINGGYNGLEDRIKKFNQIYNILKS